MTLATEATNEDFSPAGKTMPAAAAFNITVRGAAGVLAKFESLSTSSCAAGEDARARFATPVGVSVHPAGERTQ